MAFQLLNATEENDVWKLVVMWWNIGCCHTPYSMNIPDTIKIPDANIVDWQIMGFNEKLVANLDYSGKYF